MPFLGSTPPANYKTLTKQTITGDGSTSYTLDSKVANGNEIEVFVNNVRQEPGTDYSANNNTITFTTALESSDSCWLVFQSKAESTSTITNDNYGGAINVNTSAADNSVNIDASGNVGIGTTSPATNRKIHTYGSPIIGAKFESTSTSGSGIEFTDADTTNAVQIGSDANDFTVDTNFTERMRIDSSGNLLVGITSLSNYGTTASNTFQNDGLSSHTRDGGVVKIINRLTSSGDIVHFRKNNTTAGKMYIDGDAIELIGTSNYCRIGAAGNAGFSFYQALTTALPWNGSTRSLTDDAMNLGLGAHRFNDIYATNTSIQTSDQNEKQQIASLTDAEMNVAKRLSALFKTFKWNSSVEEKGDNARTHSGIIAQDMQQAFTDEGLDAGNYAMFISDTWWEKEISVDAVEANEEEGIEAQDAYTYMDSKYEATEGYTERTRLGVRYPELFAFINAYNDQRFSDLETRIETLENA